MNTFEGGKNSKCPHCYTVVHFQNIDSKVVGYFTGETIKIKTVSCPNCNKLIIIGVTGKYNATTGFFQEEKEFVLWPTSPNSVMVPKEVPLPIAEDYREAVAILNLSPRSSAALSRKCLQTILKELGKTTETNLWKQIEEIKSQFPTYVVEAFDYMREIGNFSAQSEKMENPGELAKVEPGEAEWNLEVLNMLFELYYVQPEVTKQKKQDLTHKLKSNYKNFGK